MRILVVVLGLALCAQAFGGEPAPSWKIIEGKTFEKKAGEAIRLENEERDVDRFLQVLREIADAPRSRLDRALASTYNATPRLPRSQTHDEIERFVRDRMRLVFASASL